MSQRSSYQGLRAIEDCFMTRTNNSISLLWDVTEKGQHDTNEEKWGTPKEMASTCGWLAVDIISDLSSGEYFNVLK
jgi:hypothetical protein